MRTRNDTRETRTTRFRCSVTFQFSLAILLVVQVFSSPTGLSGFGARSVTKTIFPVPSNVTTTSLSTPRSIVSSIFSEKPELTSDRPLLWAKRSRDPDRLSIQLRSGKDGGARTLTISVVNQEGSWRIENCLNESENEKEAWVPIDGIYGLYRVPSGVIWILVTKTEPVYAAPPFSEDNTIEPWWQIRKVANFELVHLSSPDMVLTTTQLKEEIRQLRLLRQSLKEHDFFFVPSQDSHLVKDMTSNLQDSFKAHLEKEKEDLSLWWQSTGSKPDPRFFWNLAAVEPILQRYEFEANDPGKQPITSALLSCVIPLTSAFVGVQYNITAAESGLCYDQLLISRRSRFRAGTRFTRRGADATGAVANFAETEQICLLRNGTKVTNVLTHMQTRGSIPLRWSSPADVKTYRPRVRIGTDPLAQARALKLHLLDQFSRYVDPQSARTSNITGIAKLIFVNLVDKSRDQGRLGRAFDAVLRAVMDVHSVLVNEGPDEEKKIIEEPPSKRRKWAYLYDLRPDSDDDQKEEEKEVRQDNLDTERCAKNLLCDRSSVEHVWFDFHAEVKDGRWDRLKSLLTDLQPALEDHGYFMASAPNCTTKKWTIHQTQKAIVRTNCMDCLDRTNVVQSLFGRYMLLHQLNDVMQNTLINTTLPVWNDAMTIFQATSTVIPWESGEKGHRFLWADNADAISRLYAGTPALKGDFTRTGERTKRGALNDGVNSLQRYYLNNFLDADRQEGMDLMVGYLDFSTVDDPSDNMVGSIDENKFISIKQAVQENFFGALIGRIEDEEAAKLKERLRISSETIADDATLPDESVDLRWISGDLQSQMISNADSLLMRTATGDDRETTPFGFSSGKALVSIDRRSYSGLPWWTDSASTSGSEPSLNDFGESRVDVAVENIDLPTPEYQQFLQLDKSQVLAVVLVGLRAPNELAAALIALLLIVFLPDVVM